MRVVAISHMPTNGGLVQPAAEIGAIVAHWPAYYLLDACQTVGQMPIDVQSIGCDMLSATSRKYLRGPRGQGFLSVKEALIPDLIPPFLDNHAATWIERDQFEIVADARRFETWERSYANILGMKAAIDHATGLGLDGIWDLVQNRASLLRERLSRNPRVQVTDVGQTQGGIVSFVHETKTPEEIRSLLGEAGINVSISSVFSTRYDMEDRGIERVVRASVHYLTTDDEIDRLCERLP